MIAVTQIAYFTAGAALAFGYALGLWMSARAIVQHRSIAPLITGIGARFGLLIGATFALLAMQPDGACLLSTLFGFLVTRALIVAAVPSRTQPPQGGR